MQINFPVRYARKNNREKSEPKLHINFRSSLSRCQSGRVNKKKHWGNGRPGGGGWAPWEGLLAAGGKDLCIKIYATPSGRHHTQSPDYSIPLPPSHLAHPCNAVRSLWARCAKTKIKHFTGIPVRHVNYEGSPRLSMWAERIRKLAK